MPINTSNTNLNPNSIVSLLDDFTPESFNPSLLTATKEKELTNMEVITKALIEVLLQKDNKACKNLLVENPELWGISLNFEKNGLILPPKLKFICNNFGVNEKDFKLTPLQYAIATNMDEIVNLGFNTLSVKDLNANTQVVESNHTKFNLSILDFVLWCDYDKLFDQFSHEKICQLWKVKEDKLFHKIIDDSNSITKNTFVLGRYDNCYPQKIYYYLIDQAEKNKTPIKSGSVDLNYISRAAYYQDTKFLKVFLKSPETAYHVVSNILNFGHNIYAPHMDLEAFENKKTAIFSILKAHFEIHKELPFLKGNDRNYPFLNLFIEGLEKNKFKNKNTILKKYFLNFEEIQNQAREFYQKDPKSISLQQILELSSNTGLNFLDKLGVQWDKKNGKPSYLGHQFLSSTYKSMKEGIEYTETVKPKVRKFVEYCLAHKSHIFQEKWGSTNLIDYLKKLGFEDLQATAEKVTFKKNLTPINQPIRKKRILL